MTAYPRIQQDLFLSYHGILKSLKTSIFKTIMLMLSYIVRSATFPWQPLNRYGIREIFQKR